MRASAGAGSFRCKDKLEGHLEAARGEVARLTRELETDLGQAERAREAARRRAAQERQARLDDRRPGYGWSVVSFGRRTTRSWPRMPTAW